LLQGTAIIVTNDHDRLGQVYVSWYLHRQDHQAADAVQVETCSGQTDGRRAENANRLPDHGDDRPIELLQRMAVD